MYALAKAADAAKRDATGWEAKPHDLIPGLFVVWAPCECVWVINSAGDGLLTSCGKGDDCVFHWITAADTLQEFLGKGKTNATPV